MPARVKPRRFEYAASVDRAGRIAAEGGAALAAGEEWTPEHLVLAALCRCSLASLAYHARAGGLDVVGAASAAGTVTRREEDDRYAFVEIECRLDVDLDPAPAADALPALLAKAERDCFVSASLTVPVAYRWRVNGGEAASA